MPINFALENFADCKSGDVLLCCQRVTDYFTNETYYSERYIIFIDGPGLACRALLVNQSGQKAVLYKYNTGAGWQYFHTTPSEWPDHVAAARMKLELEGRLND